MLQIPNWSKVVTILILVVGFLIALPNALSNSIIARMPPFLPKGTIALGLDLQGGSYLLLEVEFDQVQKDRLESLMGDIRVAFRKARIGYTNLEAGADMKPRPF
jgi:SecD/SecF fusion protein